MKRRISLFLLAAMLVCLCVPAFAAQWFGMEESINGNGREIDHIKYVTAANDVEALVIASEGGVPNYSIRADFFGLPVVEIMRAAFSCNWYLERISIPNTIRRIGDAAFQDCKNLKSVTLPSSVTELGEYAFAGSGLTSLTIPSTLQSAGQFAFNCCRQLQSVKVESGCFQTVGPYLFCECDRLRTADLAPTVTTISNRAFENCPALQTVRAPGVQKIWDRAFFDDKNLRSIVLSADLLYVGPAAFQLCEGLTDVYYAGTQEQWNAIDIRERNEPLLNANIHFNSSMGEFADLEFGGYYLDAVDWALGKGVTNGVGGGRFAPGDTCTRAQVVTFLWRAMDMPEPKAADPGFQDVPADSYYAKAVAWAVENNITNGMGDGRFAPGAACTRGQVVTFLWRARRMPAAGTANPFHDVTAGAYYHDAVLWAVAQGVTNGIDADHFAPDAACTRAQVVTFLYRDQK